MHIITDWLTVLRLTGGDLSLEKTTWSLLSFNNSTHQKNEVNLTTPTKNICVPNNVCEPTLIPLPLKYIPPNHGERYLGIRLALDGNMSNEYTYRLEQAHHYKQQVQVSSFNRQEAWLSYHAVWLPRMRYSLPLTTFTSKQCRKLQKPSLDAFLPKLGLNRNMPRVVLHGPLKYGGLEIPNMYIEQGLLRIRWFIKLNRCHTNLSKLLQITIRYAQLEAGLGHSIFESTHLQPYLS